jgi:tetratricopeptide (TPR) repeat protein
VVFLEADFAMSRFGNLEFEPEFSDALEEQPGPKDEGFYLAQAQSAFEVAGFEKALRFYAKALEFNPNSAAAYTGQVRALIELGEFFEGVKWATKALEQFPHDSELLAAKAVALGRSGDLETALAFSDASVEERGNTPYIWLARADVLLANKEARGEYCLEKAVILARGDWFILWLAARIRMFYQQFVAAIKLLEQATALRADAFIIWLDLGRCQLELGLRGRAQDSFHRVLELNPHCSEAHAGLTKVEYAGLGSRIAGAWHSLFG